MFCFWGSVASFFFDGIGRRGWGGVFAMGVARLGCVDKELIGIFAVVFVFVVVWPSIGLENMGVMARRGDVCVG